MSLFEKIAILGSLAGVGLFSIFQLVRPQFGKESKEQILQKREELLQNKNMRILYSTMTFFYLYGFQQEKSESFFTLYDILSISKPQIIAIQLSKKDYEQDYQKIIQHPRFPEIMQRVEIYLKQKNAKALESIEDIDLKNLEKLYIIDYCKKNKCSVIFSDIDQSILQSRFENKIKLQQMAQQEAQTIPLHLKQELYSDSKELFKQEKLTQKIDSNLVKAAPTIYQSEEEIKKEIFKNSRQDFFVNQIINEVQPKYSLLPSNPYKTIVGLVEPEHLNPVAKLWKSKFRSVYGHEILEDESIQINDDDD